MFGKILIVGDVHLGKGTSLGKISPASIYNSRHLDQISLLFWILEQVKTLNIETIVLTGDIFEDAKPDYPLVQVFLQILQQLSSLGVDTHIILGNHDLKRIGKNYFSILEILDIINFECVYLHKQITSINYGNIDLIFLPFLDRRYLECDTQSQAIEILNQKIKNELKNLSTKTIKIGIGHLTLNGALYVGDEIDDLTNEIFCPLESFNDFDYVWMGHIHKPQVLSKKPYLAHVGSLDLSNFEENNQTKIMICIDPSSKNFFEHIPIPTRPLVSINYEIQEPDMPFESLDDYAKYSTEKLENYLISQSLKNAIVRLEVKIPITCAPLQRDKIEQVIYAMGAHHLSSFIETRKNIVVKDEKKTLDNTIEPKKAISLWAKEKVPDDKQSSFIQYMNDKVDKSLAKKK